MWTLIKAGFWFSLVLVLLPVFHSGSSERLANAPPVNFTDAFGVASGAYDYVANLCTEKPDVCDKGGRTFTALGFRAKEGALIAYEYLNTKFGDKTAADPASADAAKPAPVKTVAAAKPAPAASEVADNGAGFGLGSLLPSSLQPAAYQPMPGKPQPYRPPVMDKVLTGTVPAKAANEAAAASPLPQHIPVPLPRPYPES